LDFEGKRFIVGIDLGTTNSAVAYVDRYEETQKNRGIKLFKIPQITGPGEVTQLSMLPSFCYIPGQFDIAKDATRLPWKTDDENFVGVFARDHGSKIPTRLVSSAKSWLCHSGADRRSRILPWGSGTDINKISPVVATASYLKHFRLAWNHSRGDDDESYLENQTVIITVPASFDEVARDLTIEAAALSGLKNITLLEEPLAAFYSWLMTHEDTWKHHIRPGELVFICDVGGGTTDFTLITLQETEGTPRFQRIAVGDHLILGGDNIDLDLARRIEQKISKANPLRADRLKTLCHLCRQAKENILNNLTDNEIITMIGEGSSLIGGTLTAKIDRSELEKNIMEGFFPLIKDIDAIKSRPKKGITEFGLPYESEPAITRHIGILLEKHRLEVLNHLQKTPFPDFILFNGGSLKAQVIQERIREAIRFWFSEKDSSRPKILDNPNPDLAVALGAAYYGLVKAGKGVRVGSGSARSYYLGFDRKDAPKSKESSAICLVERGLDEGMRIRMRDYQFEVLANQPVAFDLYSSSFRSGDKCGDMVRIDDTMTRLPAIQTIVQFGQKGLKTSIPVEIEAEYTELGVLALWCQSLSTPHRWRLQFQLRGQSANSAISDTETFESSVIEQAVGKLKTAFSEDAAPSKLSQLIKGITASVNRSKEKWPLSFIRRLADELLDSADARRYSPDHEIRWLNLAGFCLRPGYGDAVDEQRIKTLWKIYKPSVCFRKNPQSVSEWWILWRRVAGGLTSGQQRQIIQDIRPVLFPKKNEKIKLHLQEELELWMAVGNMERLSIRDKVEFGRKLLSDIQPKKVKPQYIWVISRIGARSLLYGPVDRVIPPSEIEKWIQFMMQAEWNNIKPVGSAIVQLARRTGDRSRDIDPKIIDQAIKWMARNGLNDEISFLETIVAVGEKEKNMIFGEELPSGIIIK